MEYSYFCVLPIRKIWHFSTKFDQHSSLYCGSVELKLQTMETSRLILVRYHVQNLLTIFVIVSSKIHFKAVTYFFPIKEVHFETSVNVKRYLQTLASFTLPGEKFLCPDISMVMNINELICL